MFGNQQPWTPYQPQQYRPQYGQMQGAQPAMDPGMINARYVSCREEAVAAQILPDGNPYLFVNAGQGRIYYKCVNPQTGIADFREFADVQQQPQQGQYATASAMEALIERVDKIEQMLTTEAM